MWTVLETILLGIVLLYASVGVILNYFLINTIILILSFYPYTGCHPFFPCLHRTLSYRTVVTWIGFYNMLWCHHFEIISTFSWFSYTQSSSLGFTWRWFAQIFGHNGFCCCLLYVCLYRIVPGSIGDSTAGEFAWNKYEYVPTT